MRKLLRSMARANMERAGIRKMNKTRYMVKNGMMVKCPSFFAAHWKEWI